MSCLVFSVSVFLLCGLLSGAVYCGKCVWCLVSVVYVPVVFLFYRPGMSDVDPGPFLCALGVKTGID